MVHLDQRPKNAGLFPRLGAMPGGGRDGGCKSYAQHFPRVVCNAKAGKLLILSADQCEEIPVLVLIDESGDPGFKLVRGSSSHFVVAMVIFDDFSEAERASAAIGALRIRLQLKAEFKFSKSHDQIKDAFFECVCGYRFKVRAIVVDKSVIYRDSLRAGAGNR